MKKYGHLIGLILLTLLFSLVSANISFGKPYYQGKTVAIMVPHAPGGGTDVFARLIARYISKYVPGEPTIIVRNMLGGDTLVCANYVYLTAKKDGLTAMAGSGATALHSFLRTKGTRFTYDDMPTILGVGSGDIFFTHTKLCSRREDIVKVGGDLVFGGSTMPFSTTTAFMLGRDLLGFKPKKRDVLAFDSASRTRQAFLAGELDIMGESTIGYAKGAYPFVKKGEVLPLWQTGVYDSEGRLVRQGGVVADVPTIKELYEKIYGKTPSGPIWDAMSAYIAYNKSINKSLLFPPKTEKYAAIFREAGTKMTKDLKFQKDAEKMFVGEEVLTGEVAVKIMKNASVMAKTSRKWLQEWLHKGWGVEFEK